MKLGISSYALHPYMGRYNCDIYEAIKAAKELGYQQIEFISTYEPEGVSAADSAKQIKDFCSDTGMEITAYTIGADLLVDGEDDRLIKELEIAKILGAPLMRHDISGGFTDRKRKCTYDDLIPIVAPKIRRVTEYAQSMGIKTMTENHGFFSQDSCRVEKLINAVDSENFGALVDIGNFLCADEDPAKAVARMAQYAFHVHIKDFIVKPGTEPAPGNGWICSRAGNWLRGTIVGHGSVPVLQCLRILQSRGYSGNYSLEFEGLEDGYTAMELTKAFLDRHVG
ncbi:MAG: sugar phosphate isomerase/epimerase [Clostridiales bacterium]|nr:MAG: sugar phosphate isomerase/epimerase [Clostridiales bacterium]